MFDSPVPHTRVARLVSNAKLKSKMTHAVGSAKKKENADEAIYNLLGYTAIF